MWTGRAVRPSPENQPLKSQPHVVLHSVGVHMRWKVAWGRRTPSINLLRGYHHTPVRKLMYSGARREGLGWRRSSCAIIDSLCEVNPYLSPQEERQHATAMVSALLGPPKEQAN